MISKYLVFWLGFLFSCSSFGQPELIKSNINRDLDLISSEQKNKIWDLEDIADEKGFKEIRSIIAFIPKEGGENYFLERKLIVGSINERTKAVKAWPLTPWAYRLKMQGEGTNWEVQKGLQGVYGIEKPLEPIDSPVSDELPYQLDAYNDYLGCLSKTPLRYGDFDNDAQTELMLFLNNDLVVFSPQKEKIVFSTTLAYKDELAESQLGIAFGESREDLIFQYYSAQGSLKPFTAPFAAQRSYAKVYVGNFENKDTYDVIVWRKLYHSRLNSDPIKGFEHNADLLIHYQRNELGEYLPQDTRPETIQGWLNANKLTWQKGFPSKSECAGEEGKLIPEMHDPLLNDPGVLK